jgi:hypothetical protein
MPQSRRYFTAQSQGSEARTLWRKVRGPGATDSRASKSPGSGRRPRCRKARNEATSSRRACSVPATIARTCPRGYVRAGAGRRVISAVDLSQGGCPLDDQAALTTLMPGTAGIAEGIRDIEGQGQLRRGTDLLDERGQRGPQVSNCLIRGGTITHRTDTRPELGGRTPYTVFILFDRVGHVNTRFMLSILANLRGSGTRGGPEHPQSGARGGDHRDHVSPSIYAVNKVTCSRNGRLRGGFLSGIGITRSTRSRGGLGWLAQWPGWSRRY